jgi:hypothetical protein
MSLFSKVYEQLYREKFVILPNRGSDSCRFEDISDAPVERIIKVVKHCILDTDLIKTTTFIPGSKEVLNKMFKNYTLPIITKRPIETYDSLLDLFHKNLPNVPDIEIYCTSDPFGEKLKSLQELGCSYFIDDKLQTCCYLWEKGIHAILFKSISNRVFIDVVKNAYSFFPTVLGDWHETEMFLKTIL